MTASDRSCEATSGSVDAGGLGRRGLTVRAHRGDLEAGARRLGVDGDLVGAGGVQLGLSSGSLTR